MAISDPVSLRLDHAGTSVASLAVSEVFYRDVFGFSHVEDRFTLAKYNLRGMVLRNDVGARIELFEKQGSVPMRAADPNEGSAFHGWFQVAFASRDVAADYARVVKGGATAVKPPFIAPDGLTTVAFVADPDGNLIELIERAG